MAHTTTAHDQQMLHAHPHRVAFRATFDEAALLACLQACLDCAQSCMFSADACSAEEDPKVLAKCIRLNNDCADMCSTTARIITRQSEPDAAVIRAVVDACALSCVACANECAWHSKHMDHCRMCAEACQACVKACRRLFTTKVSA